MAVPVEELGPSAALIEGEGHPQHHRPDLRGQGRDRSFDRVEPARGRADLHPRHQAGKHGRSQPGDGLQVTDAQQLVDRLLAIAASDQHARVPAPDLGDRLGILLFERAAEKFAEHPVRGHQ